MPFLNIWRYLIITFVLSFYAHVNGNFNNITYTCPDGWFSVAVKGTSCYRLFGLKEVTHKNWENALHTCQSIGSQLARVDDYYVGEDLLHVVKKYQLPTDTVWIGMNRIGISDLDTVSAKWNQELASASLYEGKWANNNPDTTKGDCVYLNLKDNKVEWYLGDCKHKMAYICERKSCPIGSFFCNNGKCINQKWKCDNDDDCGDFSDETDCDNTCRKTFKEESGTLTSVNYPNLYEPFSLCLWTVVAKEGYLVKIEFEDFVTEKDADYVQILVGGRTEATSHLVATLSGLQSQRLQYQSYNNYIIIKFVSDPRFQMKGFKLKYWFVIDNSPSSTELTAGINPALLTSPNYPVAYLGRLSYSWTISTETKRQVVTIERLLVDLNADDSILILDGSSPASSILYTYTSDHNDNVIPAVIVDGSQTGPQFVISTGQHIHIILNAKGVSAARKGFQFRYWQGCDITMTTETGEIYSPGYTGGLNYADFQTCTWTINVASGNSLRLFFDSGAELQDGMDFLQVYSEATEANPSKAVHTGNGFDTDSLKTSNVIDSSNGTMFLKFITDAVINKKGFKAVYSIDCPDPQFNRYTVVSGTPTWKYRDTKVISCLPGYSFLPDRINVDYTITCQFGGELDKIIPQCQPVYCGVPAVIANGFILKSTGFQYQDEVTFQCYPGYYMQGNDTVVCQDDILWSIPPTCLAASCPRAPEVPNAQRTIVEGDLTSYGSVIQYQCDPGYEIVGDPLIFCKEHNTWSASPPSCQKLRCFLPKIKNGEILSNVSSVEYEEEVSVKCHPGFRLNSTTAENITCTNNQTFDQIPTCDNIDECTARTSACDHNCHDNIGNYTCSCHHGYYLGADGTSCYDILECEQPNKGGCNQNCTDVPGGYQCSCYTGYQLFTENGTSNFTVEVSETGLLQGDIYHYNHTCVRILCPDPPSINNSELLTSRQNHNYGDTVEYFCNLGYILEGDNLFTCTNNGTWYPVQFPQCRAMNCSVEDYQSFNLTNPPVSVTPSDYVQFNETLSIECSVPGKPRFTKERRCIYNQTTDSYHLYGEDYECGVIDCGVPVTVNGADYVIPNNTRYGSLFNFTCSENYTMTGQSTNGSIDNQVSCLSDGTWDYGSLQCMEKTCTDPGYPVGGRANVTINSLTLNGIVTFTCDRPGFVLDPDTGIECVMNPISGAFEWNTTVPSCIDKTKPVFSNCPSSMTLKAYTKVNFTNPTVTDNSGMVREFTVSPLNANTTLRIERTNVTVTYTAVDYANNEQICSFDVYVADEEPPLINNCPSSRIEYITRDTVLTTVTANTLNVTDNVSVRSVTIVPVTISVSIKSVGPQIVEVTAIDEAGNTDTCTFEIDVRAQVCSESYLPTPLHGTKTCRPKTGNTGLECDIECNNGYFLFNDPQKTVYTMECVTNGNWNKPTVPACTKGDRRPVYTLKVNSTYIGTNGLMPDECTNDTSYITNVTDLITAEAERLQENCTAIPSRPSFNISSLIDMWNWRNVSNELSVQYTITIGPEGLTEDDYTSCVNLIKTLISTEDVTTVAMETTTEETVSTETPTTAGGIRVPIVPVIIEQTTSQTTTESVVVCPDLKVMSVTFEEEGLFCTDNMKFFQIGKVKHCFACPEGMYSTGSETCSLCPHGSYSSGVGVSSCVDCPSNKSTSTVGSVSSQECVVPECTAGYFSISGFPSCSPCPLNTYWENSTTCEDCPLHTITYSTASTLQSQCYGKCAPGRFSVSGYEPDCRACPKNYYQPNNGSTDCLACPDDTVTMDTASINGTDCVDAEPLMCLPNTCLNNGNCTIRNHTYHCVCPEGIYGRHCENEVDHCLSEPCYNGASCISTKSGYSCICPEGTSGPRCETDLDTECQNDTCQNFGVCLNRVNSSVCICRERISDRRCSTVQDVCSLQPCLNNGTCHNYDGVRRKCFCQAGYVGTNCETNISECDSNPCFNGGLCEDRVNGYFCNCTKGYTGTRCEMRTSPCVNCNAGTCADDFRTGSYRCVCDKGLTNGDYCDYDLEPSRVPSLSQAQTKSNVSVQDCMTSCGFTRGACHGFVYHTDQRTCYTFTMEMPIEATNGQGYNVYRKRCIRPTDDFYTPWYSIDNPEQNGGTDDERLTLLQQYGIVPCKQTGVVGAECRVVNSTAQGPEDTNDNITIGCGIQGLQCDNTAQQCQNYEVRYRCSANQVFQGQPCTNQSYCSYNQPCQNNGTCVDDSDGYHCNCLPGFTGSLCQHNIDDCPTTNPCLNGGVCVDGVNKYKCQCKQGFSGFICQQNINDCFVGACVQGTCKDGIDRFTCECYPGYEGPTCADNIKECLSFPCLHGGTCEDGIDDFLCKCQEGWTGKRCETIKDVCITKTPPCATGSNCTSLFNDYQCSCGEKQYGRHCGNIPEICTGFNPCVNTGQCQKGDPHTCVCGTDYTGPGCELVVDHCADPNKCQNGGSCVTLPHQLGYKCQCAKGFLGRNCEKNVDECLSAKCPTDSTCIDLVDGFHCRCHLGLTGEFCHRNINTDYDLYFYLPTSDGYAALPIAIPLIGKALTISLWVRFLEKSMDRTFFSMYLVENLTGQNMLEPLIEFDSSAIHMYDQGLKKSIPQKYHTVADGQWHNIVLTWDSTKGAKYIVDTISQGQASGILNGHVFNQKVWIVIGGKLGLTTKQPYKDKGLRGYISQLNIYSRVLNFEHEIPTIYESPRRIYNGTILRWSEFKLHYGVQPVYPSKASKNVCTTGCTLQDKIPPSTSNCPADLYVYSKEKLTSVTWTEPTFQGASLVKRKYIPGEFFTWGKYHMTYEAIDENENADFCNFDIYVQADQCSTPVAPSGLSSTCATRNNYHGCSIQCSDNTKKVSQKHPRLFTCGPSGFWDHVKKTNFRFPTCGKVIGEPDEKLEVVISYPLITTQNCLGVKDALRAGVLSSIKSLHGEWGSELCTDNDCSDVSININCQNNGTRKKRAANPTVVTVVIPKSNSILTSLTDPNKSLSAQNVLTWSALNNAAFGFSATIPTAIPNLNGFSVTASSVCDNTSTVIGGNCVQCGPGTYLDSVTKTCLDCPVGQYTEEEGSTACIDCPSGNTTQTTGTYNSNMCYDSCKAGYLYNLTSDQCEPCDEGYYQENPGKFNCEWCGNGKTTRSTGTTSRLHCYDKCPSGKELSIGGLCIHCPVGTYRVAGETKLCTACPVGNTTLTTGSTSEEACNIKACEAGYKRVGTDTCEKCPIGTYQDRKWQTTCISCGGTNFRTDLKGSTSASDCRFYCPSGYRANASSLTCEACPQGYFKDNYIHIYSDCILCPVEKTTVSIATTDINDCSLMICQEGYMSDGTKCMKCPKGHYQPAQNQTECFRCPLGTSTPYEGAVAKTECKAYCSSGQELHTNGSCIDCNVGYYKDNTISLFMKCTACPWYYITPSTRSISSQQCYIRTCRPGTIRTLDDSACIACQQGTYQDLPYQQSCKTCPQYTSTKWTGAVSRTECLSYCESGYEKNEEDRCVPCDRGYFKDNKIDVFSMCELCPLDKITPNIAAVSQLLCTVGNCIKGYKIDGETCVKCPVGTYQPDRWQMDCIQCPVNTTTADQGATTITDCFTICRPGYEKQEDKCVECNIGFYKTTTDTGLCTQCPLGFSTDKTGADNPNLCSVPNCLPGHKLENNRCVKCGFDHYQPSSKQTSCIPCDQGYFTFDVETATAVTQCKLDCASGSEIDPNNDQVCRVCLRGFYRDRNQRTARTCQACPNGFTTEIEGATSINDCSLANCVLPGQYIDTVPNVCRDCPIGQYNALQLQKACSQCPVNYTTQTVQSVSIDACIRQCPSGFEPYGSQCFPCPIGKYRDISSSGLFCQTCPGGFITSATGSTSSVQCNRSPCFIGEFFNTVTRQCDKCALDFYQNQMGKFSCERCPNGRYTTQRGSVSVASCLSHCDDASKNNCSLMGNADCYDDAFNGFTCRCQRNHVEKDDVCVHDCDANYCLHGTCIKEPLSCICHEKFIGKRCDVMKSTSGLTETDKIIIGTLSALVGLLILAGLVICCCTKCGMTPTFKSTHESPLIREPTPTPEPIYCTAHHEPMFDRISVCSHPIVHKPIHFDHYFGGFGPKSSLHFRDKIPKYIDRERGLNTDTSMEDIQQLPVNETIYKGQSDYDQPAVYIPENARD